MFFILISALCSVAVAIFLKLSVQRGFDAVQLVGWNYFSAACLCAFFWQPPGAELASAQVPWLALLSLSVALPGIFLALTYSLRTAGLVKTEVAQRMSLLLSLAAAFLWFGETVTILKIIGLVLGLLAVAGMVMRSRATASINTAKPAHAVWPVLLFVWFGYALIDVLLKEISRAGVPFTLSLLLSFSLAFVGMLVWQIYRHLAGIQSLTMGNCWRGLLLGVLNFANIGFYILAHQRLAEQPAVVFAMMNILVVLLGTLAGTLLFREHLSRRNWAAVVLAVAAIVVLAISRI